MRYLLLISLLLFSINIGQLFAVESALAICAGWAPHIEGSEEYLAYVLLCSPDPPEYNFRVKVWDDDSERAVVQSMQGDFGGIVVFNIDELSCGGESIDGGIELKARENVELACSTGDDDLWDLINLVLILLEQDGVFNEAGRPLPDNRVFGVDKNVWALECEETSIQTGYRLYECSQ